MKRRNSFFCNNCNRNGHNYHNCPDPIISFGILCFRMKEKGNIEYLLVRRLNSFAFTDFMRGRYPPLDFNYIKILVSRMTSVEHEYLKKYTFDVLWKLLWKDNLFKHQREYNFCKKFYDIIMSNESFKEILESTQALYSETEWGLCKGKSQNDEFPFDTAKREFQEEAGISSKLLKFLDNIPLVEDYTNDNNKSYKSIYFIAQYTGNPELELKIDPNNINQCTEIDDIRWVSITEAIKLIRPYYTQKINCLLKAEELILKG